MGAARSQSQAVSLKLALLRPSSMAVGSQGATVGSATRRPAAKA